MKAIKYQIYRQVKMTKPPRAPEEVGKIRDSIIETSLEIMIKEGYDRVTMRRIASKMKMSATNLYNYFSNKDEIYINILIKGYRRLHAILKKIKENHSDPLQRGREFIRAYLSFGIEYGHYYDIMFDRPTPKYNDYVGTPLEHLAQIEMDLSKEIIVIAVETISEALGDPPAGDPEFITRKVVEVWSLLHGMIALRRSNIVGYVAGDTDTMYDSIIDDIMDGLLLGTR